jgi:hypothetical protein
MPRLGERFAYRLRSQLVEKLSQNPNAGRERIAVVLNDVVKLPD